MIEIPVARRADLGQVWTPAEVALRMAKMALEAAPNAKYILDPACGPGIFSSALIGAGGKSLEMTCYDVDKIMQGTTIKQNRVLGIRGDTKLADYLADETLAGIFDLVIMNPPYIRHETILPSKKQGYHKYLSGYFGLNLNKRSNLFVLFLLKSIVDLKPEGVLCAIVYDAITQAKYGEDALRILNQHAQCLVCQPVKEPFDDVLVDAQILIYKKRFKPLDQSKAIKQKLENGLVPLKHLLSSRRGTGFSPRKLFLASSSDSFFDSSEPIFIKQSTLSGLVVEADQRAYLFEKEAINPIEVDQWLVSRAEALGMRPPNQKAYPVKGPIVFNYYIRNAPRHLWNPKNVAISDNFYVSTCNNDFPNEVAWLLLNSEEYLGRLCQGARSQGNGLLKLQLYEYQNVAIRDWTVIPKEEILVISKLALSLIANNSKQGVVRQSADKVVREVFDV